MWPGKLDRHRRESLREASKNGQEPYELPDVQALLAASTGRGGRDAPLLGRDFGVRIEDLKAAVDLNRRISAQALRTLREARREEVERRAKTSLLLLVEGERSQQHFALTLGSVLANPSVQKGIREPLYTYVALPES
eukprot:scaffold7340_cov266-Pinguiococcus_pyrenoidosus.AAC.31